MEKACDALRRALLKRKLLPYLDWATLCERATLGGSLPKVASQESCR